MTERHKATSHDRLIAALNDPNHLFTADQVAYLMATSGRWAVEAPPGESLAYKAAYEAGYQARIAEENQQWPPAPVWTAEDGRMVEQAKYRAKVDEIASQPCVGDYQGGPVEWEDRGWRNDVHMVAIQTRKLVAEPDINEIFPQIFTTTLRAVPIQAPLPGGTRFSRSTSIPMGSAA